MSRIGRNTFLKNARSFRVLNARKVAPSFSNFRKCAICLGTSSAVVDLRTCCHSQQLGQQVCLHDGQVFNVRVKLADLDFREHRRVGNLDGSVSIVFLREFLAVVM